MVALAPINIDYSELEGSPKEGGNADGATFTRTLKCPWDDRFDLVRQFMGGRDSSGRYFQPDTYDPYPAAIASDWSIAPWFSKEVQAWEGDNRKATYDYAQVTITYSTPDLNGGSADDEETLVTETLEPNAEFLTLPGKFFWDPEESTAQQEPLGAAGAPAKLIRSLDWVYTIHELVNLPIAMLNLIGTANSTALTSASLGWTFDAETLLYNPPSLRRTITTEGAKAWEATLRFSYRPNGWNKIWNPDTGAWQEVFLKGRNAPAKLYELSDLKQLQITGG